MFTMDTIYINENVQMIKFPHTELEMEKEENIRYEEKKKPEETIKSDYWSLAER